MRLEDHAILVGLRIDRRDLALAEGVVERVVDRLHRDAEPAGGFAVDLDLHAQAALLRLRGDVEQPRGPAAAARVSFSDHSMHLAGVGADQRVLILRAARPRADLDVLHRLEVDGHAGDRRDRPLQAADDVVDGRAALVARRASVMARRPAFGVGFIRLTPRIETTPVTSGSFLIAASTCALQPLHLGERDFGAGLRHGEDQAGVLRRQEALRHDDIEPDRGDQRRRA